MSPRQNLNIISSVQLSIMTALFGEITPNLRAVILNVIGNSIKIISYYDGIIDENLREDVSCMETEVMADFSEEYEIEWKAVRLDFPEEIKLGDAYYVMKRKE